MLFSKKEENNFFPVRPYLSRIWLCFVDRVETKFNPIGLKRGRNHRKKRIELRDSRIRLREKRLIGGEGRGEDRWLRVTWLTICSQARAIYVPTAVESEA